MKKPTKKQLAKLEKSADEWATKVQKYFVLRFREAMIDQGIKQKDVACLCGMSQSYLSELFSCKKSMSFFHINMIANALDMNPYFFGCRGAE